MDRRPQGDGKLGSRRFAPGAGGFSHWQGLARAGSVAALALLLTGCGGSGPGALPGGAGAPPPPGGMGPGSVVLAEPTVAPTSTSSAAPSPTAKPKATVKAEGRATGGVAPAAHDTPASAKATAKPPAPTATPVRQPAPTATAIPPAPAPKAPPPTPTTSDAQVMMHRVQRGETVYHIAKTYGVTVAAILQANHLDDPRKLRAGQLLRVPLPDGVAQATRQ